MNFMFAALSGALLVGAGASPEAFSYAVLRAAGVPQVRAQGTIPTSPLITQNNYVAGLLSGTAAMMGEVVSQVQQTRHELLIQNYEWEDGDESAKLVLRAIETRVARALTLERGPLNIQILLDDSWPSLSSKHRDILMGYIRNLQAQPLAKHRVHVELASYIGVSLGILHSKSVIRDRERGLIMTGNYKTLGGVRRDYYNMGVLLGGPVVETLRDDWLSARQDSMRTVAAGPEPESFEEELDAALDLPPLPGNLQATVLTRRPNDKWRDQGDANPQDRGLIAAIATARSHLRVLNPALNVPAIINALINAVVKQQVHVDLILSLNMDRKYQRYLEGGDNAQSAYKLYASILDLAGPGVADRLHVFWASSDGRSAAQPNDAGNVHAKATSFDDDCLWIGSMNWDKQSWNNSRELSVVLFGAQVVHPWVETIFAPRRATAVPIQAEDLPWKHRHSSNRVYTYLASRGRDYSSQDCGSDM